MVNTLQFTRTTKLAWRFPENTEDTEGEQEGDSGSVCSWVPVPRLHPGFFPCVPESAKQAWWFL
jgi:hypothetical protein